MSADTVVEVDTRTLDLKPNESPTDFELILDTPIRLPSYAFTLSLNSLNTWYSFRNFDFTEYGNTEFTFTKSGTTTTISIPNGIYNVAEVNTAVKNGLDGLSPFVTSDFEMTANSITGTIIINLDTGVELSFNHVLAQQLGFLEWTNEDVAVKRTRTFSILTGASFASVFTPTFTNGIDRLSINTDLTSGGTTNGQATGTLASFIPLGEPYSAILYEPINPLKLQVNKTTIEKIRISLTDQSGRIVNLQGEHLVLRLVIQAILRS